MVVPWKSGSTRVILSEVASPEALAKAYVKAVAVLYVAGESVRALVVSELATMAVELGMIICW